MCEDTCPSGTTRGGAPDGKRKSVAEVHELAKGIVRIPTSRKSRDNAFLVDGDDGLSLADGPKRCRSIREVAKAALEKDRRHDPMTAVRVGPQFLHEVPTVRPVPQVMMRVTDCDIRLKDYLHDVISFVNRTKKG